MALAILRVMASLIGLVLALAAKSLAVCFLALAIYLHIGEASLRRVWK